MALWIAMLLIAAGLFFFTVGVIGVLRLPDCYSRLHAAGMCDSLAAVLVVAGVAVCTLADGSPGSLLVSLKILAIALFIFIASPTATHAITKAALVLGIEPWQRKDKTP